MTLESSVRAKSEAPRRTAAVWAAAAPPVPPARVVMGWLVEL